MGSGVVAMASGNPEYKDRLFSFIFSSEEHKEWMLSLYEQQSTFNPNMPFKMLEYTANLFEKFIKRKALNKYRPLQIMLTVLLLVVFYNGISEKCAEFRI